MQLQDLKLINQSKLERKAVVQLTWLSTGKQETLLKTQLTDHVHADCLNAVLDAGESKTVEIEGEEVFINLFLPPVKLVVVGAVHIAQALAAMAQLNDISVSVVDPREAFANTERFPNVDLHVGWPSETFPQIGLDEYTAVATLTHDPKIDDIALTNALTSNCFYIGALGSKRTHAARIDRLKNNGVSEDLLERIHAPIGLDIGATNPVEIAVSILAEMTQVLRKGD